MRLPNLSQRSTIALCVGIVFTGLPLLALRSAGDPYAAVRALVVGAAFLVLAFAVREAPPLRPLRLPAALLGAAALAYGISALINGLPSAVFGVHARYLGLVAGCVMVGSAVVGALVMRSDVLMLVWPLAVVGAIEGLVVIVQRAIGALPGGTMGNQVLVGSWLCVASTTVLAAALVTRGRTRWILLACTAVTAMGAGATGSRGAWVGLVVGAVVVAVLVRRRGLVLAAGVVVALLVGIAVVGGPESLSKLQPSALTAGSAASRWQIWLGTSAMIADHPVAGVGPGRFLYEFPAYEPFERAAVESGDVRADQAHSELLQLAAEGGVPVAALVAAFFVVALIRGVRSARAKDAAALIAVSGLAASLGQGVFGITTVETGALTWLLAGIVVTRTNDAARRDETVAPVGLLWIRVCLGTLGAIIAVASSVYLVGDMSYLRGLMAFEQTDFASAVAQHREAQRVVPVVDTFRVGEADAAGYLGPAATAQALASIERGLELEPDSYDLALAKARALGLLGRDPSDVADAYGRAVELYPLGLEVRRAAVPALLAAGRTQAAETMQADLDRLNAAIRARQGF